METYTTHYVQCKSVYNAIDTRTKFGYLQGWGVHLPRTDDSLSCDEVPNHALNLHDNAELAEEVCVLLHVSRHFPVVLLSLIVGVCALSHKSSKI
jgi:hypothetical protein